MGYFELNSNLKINHPYQYTELVLDSEEQLISSKAGTF